MLSAVGSNQQSGIEGTCIWGVTTVMLINSFGVVKQMIMFHHGDHPAVSLDGPLMRPSAIAIACKEHLLSSDLPEARPVPRSRLGRSFKCIGQKTENGAACIRITQLGLRHS
jgi:hypothetical protein